MRKCLIVFLVFTIILVSCAKKQESSGTTTVKLTTVSTENLSPSTYGISNIDFLTSKTGYITLYRFEDNKQSSSLLKTTDKGGNWTVVNKNINLDSTIFVNEKVGYGLVKKAYDSKIVKTVDGGLNWSDTGFLNRKFVNTLKITNSKVIFAKVDVNLKPDETINSNSSQLFRTIDGGATWSEIKLPKSKDESLSDYSFFSAQQGYVLYGGGMGLGNQIKTLYYTDNGGKTWVIKSKTQGFDNESAAIGELGIGGSNGTIFSFSDGVIYINFTDRLAIKSTDKGVHFAKLNFNFNAEPSFINSNEGFAVRDNIFMHTTNGGKDFAKIISVNDIVTKTN